MPQVQTMIQSAKYIRPAIHASLFTQIAKINAVIWVEKNFHTRNFVQCEIVWKFQFPNWVYNNSAAIRYSVNINWLDCSASKLRIV